jgi:ribonuclease HII
MVMVLLPPEGPHMGVSPRRVPTTEWEQALWQRGFGAVAGVDEAGRGPLAGPVVAAAVVLPEHARFPWLDDVRDSKLLSAAQRARLAACIHADLPGVGTGTAEAAEIDALGIGHATRLAMLRAVTALAVAPDFLLVDGRERVALAIRQQAVVDGDAQCLSIALASVVAKVHRDQLMDALDRLYPGWGFAQHKGYPTAEHRTRLARLGPLPVHRRSYAPVRAALAGWGDGLAR